jgi:hypothetical protein
MRLKQYINEGKTSSFEEVITTIMDKCQPVIKELLPFHKNDSLLYSGRKNTSDMFIGKVRTDRKPMDTPIDKQKMMDLLFKKYHGWKPRSNSIFCTGDIAQANDYGKVYAIFPIGRFKYLWNPHIRDFFSDVIDDFVNSKTEDPHTISDIYADELESEIMRVNDKLYAETGKNPDYDEIKEIALQNIIKRNREHNKSVIEKIISGYKDNDLKKAIKSEVEIMVNCKEYVAVDFYIYGEFIRRYLEKYGNKKPTKDYITDISQSVYLLPGVKIWKDK